ncbi:hypothetical protein GCM10029978_007850 [Actinoallomurus acanthiterrae]
MRLPPWFRLMRAGAFAAVCVVLSAVAHALMNPRPLPEYAGWVAYAALTGVGYCLADRRRSAWWLLLAVEVTQVGLHLWFSAVSAPAAAGAGWDAARMHHSMPGMRQVAAGTVARSMSHSGMSGWGMLVAHAVAGALVALWLAAGERAAWRALAAMTRLFLTPALRVFALLLGVEIVQRPWRPGIDRGFGDDPEPRIGALRHTLIRRGPPAYACCDRFLFAAAAAG